VPFQHLRMSRASRPCHPPACPPSPCGRLCRVAGEHCCSPAPSERHGNLSVYAAQASPKAPRGTRWGATAPPARYGSGADHTPKTIPEGKSSAWEVAPAGGLETVSPALTWPAVICFPSSVSSPNDLVLRDPMEVSLLSHGVISPLSSTPIGPVTESHSLPPSSFTRSPFGSPRGSLSRMGRLRAYHVPHEYHDGLDPAYPPVALESAARESGTLAPATYLLVQA